MGKVIARTKIKRDQGFLYFLDKKGNVAKVAMSRAGKKASKKHIIVANIGVKKKPGCLYYIDKKGNVCEAKMMRGRKKVKRRKKRGV